MTSASRASAASGDQVGVGSAGGDGGGSGGGGGGGGGGGAGDDPKGFLDTCVDDYNARLEARLAALTSELENQKTQEASSNSGAHGAHGGHTGGGGGQIHTSFLNR